MASSSTSPWTPEEIREKASSWSLEGDGKLLEFMQRISVNLDQRATKTTSNIHHLGLEVNRTKIALENVTNQLAGLQHSQFVENRVYEDDETLANESEVPAGDQEDPKNNYDPIETLTKLLNDSMTVIERNYEKVSIDIDDSDEEDDSPKSIIYRPKDPYEQHPLPYIIGSKEWTEKWHIGICDSDEDFSGEEKADEYSDSSDSASMSTSLPSNAPTISESEFSAWGLQQNATEAQVKRRGTSYGSSEEDLSAATKESLDKKRYHANNRAEPLPYNLPMGPNGDSPASQYYIHQPKQKDGGLFNESSDESTDSELYNVKGNAERTVPYPAMRRDNVISHIFSDEPPPDVDVVDKQTNRAVDLFCESEDEVVSTKKSPEFVGKKEASPPIAANKTRKKTVNLFDDDDFDSFMKELNTKTQEKALEVVEKPTRNLFDESSGEEDVSTLKKNIKSEPTSNKKLSETVESYADIAAVSKKSENTIVETDNTMKDSEKSRPLAAPRKTLFTNLFSDEPPDDDFDSLFSDGKDAKKKESHVIVKKSVQNIFDDFDDEPSLTIENTQKAIEHSPVKANTGVVKKSMAKQPTESKLKYSNLFGDESDDESGDLFDQIVSVSSGVGKNEPKTVNTETNSSDDIEKPFKIASKTSLDSQSKVYQQEELKIAKEPRLKLELDDVAEISENTSPSLDYHSSKTQLENAICAEGKSSELPPSLKNKLNLFDDNDETTDLFARNPFSLRDTNTTRTINESAAIVNRESEVNSEAAGGRTEEMNQIDQTLEVDLENDDKVVIENQASLTRTIEEIMQNEELSDDPFSANIPPVERIDPSGTLQYKSIGPPDGNSAPSASLEDFNRAPNFENILNKDDNQNCSEVSVSSSENRMFNNESNYTTSDINESFSENQNYPISTSSSKSSQIFSTILFSEVPPNDDEHLFETSAKEPPPIENDMDSEDFLSQSMEASSSALSYNPMSLFHDIPPDDDFDAVPQDGKKLHSIFYDDFSETIIAPQIDSKPKTLSSFIFDDEPPPDSFQEESSSLFAATDQQQTHRKTTEANSITDQSNAKQTLDSDGQVASIIDRMQKGNSGEPIASVPVKASPSPKKLNVNLNINVSALLPGAKRAIPKVIDTGKNEEEKKEEALVDDEPEDRHAKMVESESDPNMLYSLNKSRAKIQVKRRPSTRKARQDNYRRSLLETNDGNAGDNDIRDEQAVTTKSSLGVDNDAVFHSSKNSTSLNNSKLEARSSKTFGEAHQTNRHNLFDSETVSSRIAFEEAPPSDILPPPVLVPNKTAGSTLFFEEDNDDVGDLVITAPSKPAIEVAEVKPTKRSEAVNVLKPNKNKSGIKLFGDDSDDDDLFRYPSKTDERAPPKQLAQQENTKNNPQELSNVKKSIFGSDDEDDDLFGSGSISESSAPKTVVLPTRLDTKNMNPSRLFDDEGENDDDDLFGGGGGDSKSKRIIAQPTSKTSEPKKVATVQSTSSGKSDLKDPLADLFENLSP